jgi:uncharacterized membrane protein YcaP (DUF421 family)
MTSAGVCRGSIASLKVPVVRVEHGGPLRDTMERERISDDEILSSARETQGLESMDQIKWAVLETFATISIVAKQEESA